MKGIDMETKRSCRERIADPFQKVCDGLWVGIPNPLPNPCAISLPKRIELLGSSVEHRGIFRSGYVVSEGGPSWAQEVIQACKCSTIARTQRLSLFFFGGAQGS